MATIAELKTHGRTLFAGGKLVPALQCYDAIVAAQPRDFEARLHVADCLAALDSNAAAIIAYRAVAWYVIKSGHPLAALVIIKILENHEENTDDLVTGVISFYGCESKLVGKYAARINLPDPQLDVPPPNLQEEPPADFLKSCAQRATEGMQDFDEYPEALHEIPLLSALSEAAFRRVISTVVVRRMADGQLVIREGEPGHSFFLLASGEVRVFTTDSRKKEQEHAVLGENSVFGEMALLHNQPRAASVAVVGEADLVELTRESLRALADELQQVAIALNAFTRERLLSNLMGRSPLFRPFSKSQQSELLGRFSEHEVTAETHIINEGEKGRGLFVVLSGQVEVFKNENVSLATLRTGDVFGEMSLLRDRPTSATVRALTPTTVLFLGRQIVYRMLARIPEIKEYLEALTSAREAETQLKLALVADEKDNKDQDEQSVPILI